MSTSLEKSHCSLEDKDERQKSLETRSTEKGEIPQDKKKNVSCNLVKMIYPSDYRKWPILSLLKPELITKIRMVMVYGNNGNRALIVTEDKNVYTFNYNNDHLKTSDTRIGLHPKKIEELCGKNIKTFACNSYFVLALTEEGQVYFWEFNKKCKLDNELHIPVIVSRVSGLNDKHIMDIACGSGHSLVLTNDGKVYAWGENDYGQVGDKNSIFDDSLPRQVKHELEGKKIVQIACGSNFNIVITDTGELYGWGNNESCQILYNVTATSTSTSTVDCHDFYFNSYSPTSSNTSRSGSKSNKVEWEKYYVYPIKVSCKSTSLLLEKVIVKVSCGFKHTLALTDKGKIYTWGKNDKGQTGVNNNLPFSAPTLVNIPELVEDIAAYGDLSAAISNNKIVYVWGDCFGQHIKIPFPTEFSSIHDTFAYSESRVMYKPLIVSTNDYDYFEEVLNIVESLKTGFDDPATSDCIVEVEGQRIHVHKAILQIRCECFKKLEHDWFQSQDVPIVNIVSDKFSYIVYKAFLKYLYTGTIDLSSEDTLDLMKLADNYGETNLKKECSRIIEQVIEVSNVALYYSKAIEYNAKELEELCFQFALRHMKDVIVTNNYVKLDTNTKYELLFRAVKNYDFQM